MPLGCLANDAKVTCRRLDGPRPALPPLGVAVPDRHRMNRFQTAVSRQLGLRFPIVQAPIGSATTSELASEVSNAGALGSLSISWRDLRQTREIVRRTAALTPCPFAVNLVLAWPQEARVRVALEAGARVIWTSWGDPGPLVGLARSFGATIMHTVGSVAEGEGAADQGVDVIVAQGVEAGGHVRGTLPWRELLAGLLGRLGRKPVLVAGGMADGRDLASALAEGAAGACFGTRFICSTEANVARRYQEAILGATDGDTLLTSLFNKGWEGAPHRVLRNSTVRRWEAAGSPNAGARPGECEVVAFTAGGEPIERYSDAIPTQGVFGEIEALALYAGQSSARIRTVCPAGQIVAEILDQAALALSPPTSPLDPGALHDP